MLAPNDQVRASRRDLFGLGLIAVICPAGPRGRPGWKATAAGLFKGQISERRQVGQFAQQPKRPQLSALIRS